MFEITEFYLSSAKPPSLHLIVSPSVTRTKLLVLTASASRDLTLSVGVRGPRLRWAKEGYRWLA
jgi:hypothetical protein